MKPALWLLLGVFTLACAGCEREARRFTTPTNNQTPTEQADRVPAQEPEVRRVVPRPHVVEAAGVRGHSVLADELEGVGNRLAARQGRARPTFCLRPRKVFLG